MAALNDSRTASRRLDSRVWRDGPMYQNPSAHLDGGLDTSYVAARGEDDDVDGFTLEHQLNTLRQTLDRHERQLSALTADRHEHCEQLTNVYEQLEGVLDKIQLPSGAATQGSSASAQSKLLSSSPATKQLPPSPFAAHGELNSATTADASTSFVSGAAFRKVEANLNELLRQHRDRVFDVLADHRRQIDKNDRETRQRLDTLEKSVTRVQRDVEQVLQLVKTGAEERRSDKERLRDELRSMTKQQEAHQTAVQQMTDEHAEKVQHCCDSLSACLNQLSEETKNIKKQQQRSEAEVERQIRSIVSTEQQVAEVLERQSQSLTQLETQDSLEGAFHEVKDWLGDLEKRMVSRGELLQWTESLQQEMSKLRRAAVRDVNSGASSPP